MGRGGAGARIYSIHIRTLRHQVLLRAGGVLSMIVGPPWAMCLGPMGRFMCSTKVVQGCPKLWADFRARIGIFSQSVGPSLAIWANPVQFSFACPSDHTSCHNDILSCDALCDLTRLHVIRGHRRPVSAFPAPLAGSVGKHRGGVRLVVIQEHFVGLVRFFRIWTEPRSCVAFVRPPEVGPAGLLLQCGARLPQGCAGPMVGGDR